MAYQSIPLFLVVSLFGTALWVYVIHPAFLSPLASVPNAHPLAPFTRLWILWMRYNGEDFKTVSSAFEFQGPIVRLAPKELAVNIVDDGLWTIHGGAGFAKTEYYSWFSNFGALNTFTSLGKDHAVRRRRVNHVYAQSYVRTSPQLRSIDGIAIKRMLSVLSIATSAGESVDVLSLYIGYSIDTLSAYIHGVSQGTNFLEDKSERQKWLKIYAQSQPSKTMFWFLEVPSLLKWLVALGFNMLPDTYSPSKRQLGEWALDLVDRTETSLNGSGTTQDAGSVDYPTVYAQLCKSIAESTACSKLEPFDFKAHRHELASETLDHMEATIDIFGVTFSYVLYMISLHQETQEALRQELFSVSDPSVEALAQLPLLHGVIKESLRLRRTKPTPNPRYTPVGRTKIGPYDNVPGGIRINMFSYTLNRNPDVYQDPERWRPERWILSEGTSQEAIDQQERWFWTFGKGSRGCLGQHLALQMMRSILYATYTRYSTRVSDDSTYIGRDGFVTGKMNEKLLLTYSKLPAC